jgi:tyrosyl-tRNA synthetase
VESDEAHGLVAPLVTMASGAKFGKTEAGAIYLDPALTSPYKFYQFWVNTDDRNVESYVKLFSLQSRDELKELLHRAAADPAKREAQRALAQEVTERIHGEAARNAIVATEILFGEFDPQRASGSVFDTLAREIPTTPVSTKDTLALVDAVVQSGLAKSKSEARRAIEQGGIYLNQQRVKEVDRRIEPGDWLADQNVLLRKGKKDYALLRIEREGAR